jgi:S1-C subfamily serine protease
LVVGGDIILSVEGIAVKTIDDLTKIRERTSRLGKAAPISVKVLRAGGQLKLTGRMP